MSREPSQPLPEAPAVPIRHSRLDAEVDEIVHVLRSYGVLTGPTLAALIGARHWNGESPFGLALKRGIALGRVRRLGDDLYELTEAERA